MTELSRASMEYISRRFTSPHLSRRWGHKLCAEAEDQDHYLRAMRALSEDCSADYEVPLRPVRRRQGLSATHSLYLDHSPSMDWAQLSHSTADTQLREITRNTRSWKPTPMTPLLKDGTMRNIPKIFIFHGSTVKKYFKG